MRAAEELGLDPEGVEGEVGEGGERKGGVGVLTRQETGAMNAMRKVGAGFLLRFRVWGLGFRA